MATVEPEQHPVFRAGGISYLRIPTDDPQQSATFYRDVFGWEVRDHPEHPSFEDGTGHVIGHWIRELPVVGEAGCIPYVYVERIDEVIDAIASHGGSVVAAPYEEGNLWVATFRDPSGNVVGVWQHGPRTGPSARH